LELGIGEFGAGEKPPRLVPFELQAINSLHLTLFLSRIFQSINIFSESSDGMA
jgi:hypothetical protein